MVLKRVNRSQKSSKERPTSVLYIVLPYCKPLISTYYVFSSMSSIQRMDELQSLASKG